jgi:hypothetical protein
MAIAPDPNVARRVTGRANALTRGRGRKLGLKRDAPLRPGTPRGARLESMIPGSRGGSGERQGGARMGPPVAGSRDSKPSTAGPMLPKPPPPSTRPAAPTAGVPRKGPSPQAVANANPNASFKRPAGQPGGALPKPPKPPKAGKRYVK